MPLADQTQPATDTSACNIAIEGYATCAEHVIVFVHDTGISGDFALVTADGLRHGLFGHALVWCRRAARRPSRLGRIGVGDRTAAGGGSGSSSRERGETIAARRAALTAAQPAPGVRMMMRAFTGAHT